MSHVAVHIQMDVHSKHGCGRAACAFCCFHFGISRLHRHQTEWWTRTSGLVCYVACWSEM